MTNLFLALFYIALAFGVMAIANTLISTASPVKRNSDALLRKGMQSNGKGGVVHDEITTTTARASM